VTVDCRRTGNIGRNEIIIPGETMRRSIIALLTASLLAGPPFWSIKLVSARRFAAGATLFRPFFLPP
jgi:hypothetical protein